MCGRESWGGFTRRERRVISKQDFPALLKLAWDEYKPEWTLGGFKNAGVVPFNPQAIPQALLMPSQLFPPDQQEPLPKEDQAQPLPQEGTLTEFLQLDS